MYGFTRERSDSSARVLMFAVSPDVYQVLTGTGGRGGGGYPLLVIQSQRAMRGLVLVGVRR